MTRPTKLQTYMDVSVAVSARSHDAETQVGSVLVNNKTGAIIATGFNGFVRGADDSELPNTRPEKYPYIVHSEQNLIANCARHGVSMEDTTLVCTLTPCAACMRLLWQCGITRVIAKEKYRDFDNICQMKDLSIDVLDTPEGFLELTYRAK
jgi:dCMP deaminase